MRHPPRLGRIRCRWYWARRPGLRDADDLRSGRAEGPHVLGIMPVVADRHPHAAHRGTVHGRAPVPRVIPGLFVEALVVRDVHHARHTQQRAVGIVFEIGEEFAAEIEAENLQEGWYNPNTGEVKGINALGVAPTGATPAFFREQGMAFPPEYGPLAAVTPGTPGGLMVMLAEYGKLSLAEVLAPAMQMAEGYPIEKSMSDFMERRRDLIEQVELIIRPAVGEEITVRAILHVNRCFPR